jgi:segregation and condensation protein B
MPLDLLIEGLLFYKQQPQKKSAIAALFSVSEDAVNEAITVLANRLQNTALRLLQTDTDITLVTAPTIAPLIDTLRKQDIKSDIGKAGAETLAIILYRGPITRTAIDRIRGVNSSFILRNLLIRGLVERTNDKANGGYSFSISPALLQHLGVAHKHELTDFARITDALEAFDTTIKETEENSPAV